MCTNPLLIANKSLRYNPYYSDSHFEVPCNGCAECRDSVQADWQRRLSFEINSLYKSGGHGVFITLTFNDDSLPYMRFPQSDGSLSNPVPCFDNDLVKDFLCKLKKRMLRLYGKHSYKYFIAEEYGKNTKRPHLHLLALLQSNVDIIDFYHLVNSLWLHGFIFPKYDPNLGDFVKYDPIKCTMVHADYELMDRAGSAKYVSKYVTKDIDFYSIPEISDFVSSYYDQIMNRGLFEYYRGKRVMRVLSDDQMIELHKVNLLEKQKWSRYLPKHWQSKFLGYSILDLIDDPVSAFDSGVCDPLTKEIVPLPRYAKRKLLYKSVPSDRVSLFTGKPLYDRYLSATGVRYLYVIFKNRIGRIGVKFREFLSRRGSIALYLQRIGKTYNEFSSNFDFLKNYFGNRVYDALSTVYNGSRYMSHYLRSHLDAVDLDYKIFDVDFVSRLYVANKHTAIYKYLPSHPVVSCYDCCNLVFDRVRDFLRVLSKIMALDRIDTQLFNYNKYLRICDLNRRYTSGYPLSLC